MNILETQPHYPDCDTAEPSLEALIHRYYRIHFDEPRSTEYANMYIAAIKYAQSKLEAPYLCDGRVSEGFSPSTNKYSPTNDELIDAAEARAAMYEGDSRECIQTDVMNSFYAGVKFANSHLALETKELRADKKLNEARLDYLLMYDMDPNIKPLFNKIDTLAFIDSQIITKQE